VMATVTQTEIMCHTGRFISSSITVGVYYPRVCITVPEMPIIDQPFLILF
jgi:hypothetical protein